MSEGKQHQRHSIVYTGYTFNMKKYHYAKKYGTNLAKASFCINELNCVYYTYMHIHITYLIHIKCIRIISQINMNCN